MKQENRGQYEKSTFKQSQKQSTENPQTKAQITVSKSFISIKITDSQKNESKERRSIIKKIQ